MLISLIYRRDVLGTLMTQTETATRIEHIRLAKISQTGIAGTVYAYAWMSMRSDVDSVRRRIGERELIDQTSDEETSSIKKETKG
jgi:hypothetical protein